MGDNSDTGQVTAVGSWTTTSGGTPSSNIVGPQTTVTATEGFVGYDYATAPAGTGSSTFTWNLTTPAGYQGNLHRARDHAKIQNADSPGAYLDHVYGGHGDGPAGGAG
jgi:hypothetical protein